MGGICYKPETEIFLDAISISIEEAVKSGIKRIFMSQAEKAAEEVSKRLHHTITSFFRNETRDERIDLKWSFDWKKNDEEEKEKG
jgi:hypothetical protein